MSADVYKLMFVPQINVPWEMNTWGALETLLPKFSQCAKGLASSRGPHVIAAFTVSMGRESRHGFSWVLCFNVSHKAMYGSYLRLD